MAIAQTDEPTLPTLKRPLRLWPGVIVAVLIVLIRFVGPIVVPGAMIFGVLGAAIGALAIILWWLFFSRAPWSERLGAIVLMTVALFATSRLVHASIANGLMGMMLPIFAIPVFGPLSELLSAIIPGAGYSLARQAKSNFTIKDGIIHTDDFKVSGKLFGMIGHGDIHFIEDKLDFDIRIQAGGAGVVLTPVYKLFEYKGEGPIAKPNWHPKRF